MGEGKIRVFLQIECELLWVFLYMYLFLAVGFLGSFICIRLSKSSRSSKVKEELQLESLLYLSSKKLFLSQLLRMDEQRGRAQSADCRSLAGGSP